MNHTNPVKIFFLNSSYHLVPDISISEICFLVSLSGDNNIRINEFSFDSDGSFVFIAPSTMELSIRGTGKAVVLICRGIFFDDIIKTPVGYKVRTVLSGLAKGDSFKCFPLKGRYTSIVEQLLWRISLELDEQLKDYDQIIQLHLLELLFLLKRIGSVSENELHKRSSIYKVWTIDDVIYFVEKNFDGSYTLDELASRCALNSSYFSRAFRQQAGVPLFEFINRLRITRACQLLKSSDLTILEIAFSVGYNNVSFFNRYFKRLKLVSPGEYRRRIRG